MKDAELAKMFSNYRLKIVLVVVVIAYSIAVLASPFDKGVVFWSSYLFTLVAAALQFPIVSYLTKKDISAKSRFYGFPMLRVSVVYLFVQFFFGLLCMALATFSLCPVWIALVLNVLLLAAALIGLIAADTACTEVEHQECIWKERQQKVLEWRVRSKVLAERYANTPMSKPLQRLAEQFHFSDPVSSKEIEKVEVYVEEALFALERALEEQGAESAQQYCKAVSDALTKRNEKCKECKR